MQRDALAAELVDAACAGEGFVRDQLALHADNGGAMKGKTMLVKLEQLGVVPSFSRPRVSDDNPFPEALFRTLKYRPGYPDELGIVRGSDKKLVDWPDHPPAAISME